MRERERERERKKKINEFLLINVKYKEISWQERQRNKRENREIEREIAICFQNGVQI